MANYKEVEKIYKNSEDNSLRYVLGTKGNNPLVVIGLNPSTADDIKSDPTIRKVMGFAEGVKKDSFIMINLYPFRATDANSLPKELNDEYHRANLENIETVLNEYGEIDVLVAYGDKIDIRPYLRRCMKDIFVTVNKHKDKVNWYKIGNLTAKKHPRHPLYASYVSGVNVFDIEEYVKKL